MFIQTDYLRSRDVTRVTNQMQSLLRADRNLFVRNSVIGRARTKRMQTIRT